MVFSSITFLLYFLPLFLFFYYLADKKFKNWVILIASLLFYSWGEPKFVIILTISTYLDFYIVKYLHKSEKVSTRKLLLATSIFMNVGLLAYFKYANFFMDNVNLILDSFGVQGKELASIALPIGISFYTFQTLTYSIDVYRRVHAPLHKVSDYMLYISMFPQLIAGPIVRFNTVADQIEDRQETSSDRLLGFYRFVIGLSKKVLISNVMGAKIDQVLGGDISSMDSTTAWLGILAYTFQIYFDFSGYSDMAIGLGRMMGFKFPENFDNPYTSQSITEFWRRWHMTLGDWMRNYLYIPLGGNKVSVKRLYFNLWFVFLVSGLWHGASWNFVIWGAYHGLFLIIERLFLNSILKKLGTFIRLVYTFFVVMMGWLIFRIEDMSIATKYYNRLFAFDFKSIDVFENNEFLFFLGLSFLFSFITLSKIGKILQDKIYFEEYTNRRGIVMFFIVFTLLILCIASITTSNFNPFIYFRF